MEIILNTFIKRLVILFQLFGAIFFLSACSTFEKSKSLNIENDAIAHLVQPPMKKILLEEAPISLPERSRFSISDHLPGLPFKPNLSARINFDVSGNLVLTPGDYLIPVMTYCMSSSGSSPEAHSYFLSQMQGSRARIIRDLNLRALPQFSYKDVQILSWSLQNGLKYDELTKESQKIVDHVLSEYKEVLKYSFFEQLEKKWNEVAGRSGGAIPDLSEASGELLNKMGDVGKTIAEIRNFRNQLKTVGNNYEALSSRIIQIKRSQKNIKKTPWSRISENVYARFITTGHYQELGQIQIRVLDQSALRNPTSEVYKVSLDLLSWIADPNKSDIQPLTFSPVYGFGGVLVIPALADVPILAAAVLGAVLAAEAVDWNAFQKLSQILQNVNNRKVQKKIAEGIQALNKIHDKLEKPLREKGIIDKKTKRTPGRDSDSVREYENPGGQEALDKDFEKLNGPPKKVDDVDVKQIEKDIKAVKRPASKKGQDPTLEMQPEKTGDRFDDSIRVKVRYK